MFPPMSSSLHNTSAHQQIITISLGSLCNDIIHYIYCTEQKNINLVQPNVLFHMSADKQLIPRLVAINLQSSEDTPNNTVNHHHNDIQSIANEFSTLYNNRQIVHTSSATSTQHSTKNHQLDAININYNQHNYYTLPLNCIDNITTIHEFNYVTQGLINNNSSLTAYIDGIIDGIRYWAESCDTLTGFHIFIDIDSGYSGIAIELIQQLCHEFGHHIPLVVFGITCKLDNNHIDYQKHLIRRLINRCITMSYLHEYCSLYIPLDTDTIDFKSLHVSNTMSIYDQTVHTLANIIYNITLPYRLITNFCTLNAYIQHLIPFNQLNIIGINTIIPITDQHTLLTQRQTRSQQTDTRTTTLHNNTLFTALWKSTNNMVQHISPFQQRIVQGESRRISKRNARLLDESDSDNDSDDDNNNTNTSNDMLLSELIVCRGLTNEQQMNLTINYDTLAPSGHRIYSYIEHGTQSLSNIQSHDTIPAIYCTYNVQSIGEWLHMNANALNSILGSNTAHNLHGTDTVDVRQVIQQFIKDGMIRDDLIEIASNIQSFADRYIDLVG